MGVGLHRAGKFFDQVVDVGVQFGVAQVAASPFDLPKDVLAQTRGAADDEGGADSLPVVPR